MELKEEQRGSVVSSEVEPWRCVAEGQWEHIRGGKGPSPGMGLAPAWMNSSFPRCPGHYQQGSREEVLSTLPSPDWGQRGSGLGQRSRLPKPAA